MVSFYSRNPVFSQLSCKLIFLSNFLTFSLLKKVIKLACLFSYINQYAPRAFTCNYTVCNKVTHSQPFAYVAFCIVKVDANC